MITIIDPVVNEDWIGVIKLKELVAEKVRDELYMLCDAERHKTIQETVRESLNNSRAFILMEDNQVLGIAFFYMVAGTNAMYGIWIPPESRNKGFAPRIIEVSKDYAVKLGLKSLYFWTAENNIPAMKLALKSGAIVFSEEQQSCNREEQNIITWKYDLLPSEESVQMGEQLSPDALPKELASAAKTDVWQ